MLYLEVMLLSVCVAIAAQDFKFRAVYWWLFPLLFLLLGGMVYLNRDFGLIAENLGYNLCFLGSQLLLLTGYISAKEKRLVNLFDGYFGMGDLLFLVAISIYFSFANYVLFYIFSLVFIILITLVSKGFSKKGHQQIPLAGEQALLLIGFLLVEKFSGKVELGSDQWVLTYLNI